jgi:hypothetical protein
MRRTHFKTISRLRFFLNREKGFESMGINPPLKNRDLLVFQDVIPPASLFQRGVIISPSKGSWVIQDEPKIGFENDL